MKIEWRVEGKGDSIQVFGDGEKGRYRIKSDPKRGFVSMVWLDEDAVVSFVGLRGKPKLSQAKQLCEQFDGAPRTV